jgi:hypothetical protein
MGLQFLMPRLSPWPEFALTAPVGQVGPNEVRRCRVAPMMCQQVRRWLPATSTAYGISGEKYLLEVIFLV